MAPTCRLLALVVSCALVLALSSCGGELSENEIDPATGQIETRSSALTEIFAGGEERWNDDVKLNLTYCVDTLFYGPSNFRDKLISAMATATKDWSKDVQIAFQYVADPGVQCALAQAPAIRLKANMAAEFVCTTPSGNYEYHYLPGPCPDGTTPLMAPSTGGMDPAKQTGSVWITYDALNQSQSQLNALVKHEIGHALGFDHEDANLNCSTNHQVGSKPLTAPDPKSIMLTSNCVTNPATTLSALDRQGAGILYGHLASTTISGATATIAQGGGFSTASSHALGANRQLTTSMDGTGNLDLYVGLGFFPSTSHYSGASKSSSSHETVKLNLPPYPFGQDVFVLVYGKTAGKLTSLKMTGLELTNPMDLLSRLKAETALYDQALRYPACARAGLSCDSGATLGGRGPLGPEANAPNHGGAGCVDGASGTYNYDESVEAIRVKSADSGPLRPGANLDVAVDVVAWSTTVDRLDLYYQFETDGPFFLMGSQQPAALGRTTIKFPAIQVRYGGPVQTMRAVFRYNATTQSSCPSDMSPYDDVDDLSFTVAPVYESYAFK